MLKVIDIQIGMIEVPDEISLTVGLSGCPFRCPGCHTPIMQSNQGDLIDKVLWTAIEDNLGGITCVCFLGGDNSLHEVYQLALKIKKDYELKTAIYLGTSSLTENYFHAFDFIKLGPYIEKLGGLDSPKTNQRFYQVKNQSLIDITSVFQK